MRRRMTSTWWVTQLLMNWSMRERARDAVDQRQHVGAEVGLQLGVLEKVVEDDPGDGVALEHDDQPLAGAVEVSSRTSAMPCTLPASGELGDLQREVVGVDHVGQVGDHQDGAAVLSSSTSMTARWVIEPRPVR